LKKINLNNLDKIDNKHIALINDYNQLIKKEKKLLKSIKKLRQKQKIKNELLKEIIINRNLLLGKLKKKKINLFTRVSVVYDKRWDTYICIFKNSKHQKSFYLGTHKVLLKLLSPYYQDEITASIPFLKNELKIILNTLKTKIIKVSADGIISLNNLKVIDLIELYSETGNWKYWSSDK
tara:strand:+ start:1589 stop:2125 length:537 start_codon:yes stop_codon:yes gene_type:complete